MAFTKINAAGIGTTETVTVDGLTVINDGSFGGNLSVGGTITYEDVTNVDSVGLITARNGIVVGSGITLSKDGDIFATGVTTSTTFVGNLTGTASANAVLTGSTNDTLVTVTGSNAIQGESNLTFNSSNILTATETGTGNGMGGIRAATASGGGNAGYGFVTNDANRFAVTTIGSAGAESLRIYDDNNDAERLRIDSGGRLLLKTTTEGHAAADDLTIENTASDMGITLRSSSSHQGAIYFSDGTSGDAEYKGIITYNHANDKLSVYTNASAALHIDSSGRLLLGTTTEGNADADEFTIANTSGANMGMTIRSGTSALGQIFFSDGTSGAAEYAGMIQYGHNNNSLRFGTSGSEHIRIDTDGKLLINHDSARSIAGGNSLVQVESNDSTGRISIVQNRNEASGAPFLSLGKSRGTAVGSNTIVQSGDTLGTVAFAGADGTDLQTTAVQIVAQVDGTPGSDDMPGRLSFHITADGASSPTERIRINKDGNVMITGKGASINHGQSSQLVPLFLKTSTNLTAVDTAEGASSDGIFRIEDGASEDRYHGIELRNRSGGDIRILNHDRNTSNAGDLVIAQYSAAASTGLKQKIRLSSVYDSIQIAGRGGASLTSLGENVMKTDIYITTQSDLSDPTANAGSAIAGMIRFHEVGSNNNRYHGIELRNRNSGDVRILNEATTSTNFANMVFVTDNGSQTTQRMIINGNGNIGAPSGNNIYNASDERLKENIVELTDGLNKINQIKPVSFTWKEGWDSSLDGLTQYGFGAHQVKSVDEILVESFGEKEITLNGETIDNPLRVNEKHVIPLLVKAIQELSAKVAALEG